MNMLEQVVADWPDSRYAAIARRKLIFEQGLQVGKAMPALEGLGVDGQAVSLAEHEGKVVVVDFFGFWCAPCVKGLPALAQLSAQYPREPFTVLGIDAHDKEETFRRGRAKHAITWPCIFDGPEGPLSLSLGIQSFPAVFVVDQTGIIRAKNPSKAQLKQLVQALLEER